MTKALCSKVWAQVVDTEQAFFACCSTALADGLIGLEDAFDLVRSTGFTGAHWARALPALAGGRWWGAIRCALCCCC